MATRAAIGGIRLRIRTQGSIAPTHALRANHIAATLDTAATTVQAILVWIDIRAIAHRLRIVRNGRTGTVIAVFTGTALLAADTAVGGIALGIAAADDLLHAPSIFAFAVRACRSPDRCSPTNRPKYTRRGNLF